MWKYIRQLPALKGIFVSALFQGLREGVPDRGVTRLPVKQAVMALSDPSQTAPENCTASCVITGHLVAALKGHVEFWTADHSAWLREGRTAVRRHGQIQAEEALTSPLEGDPVLHTRCLQRAAKTGAWLTVLTSTVNVTELGAQEWRNALFLWYGLSPWTFPRNLTYVRPSFWSVTPLSEKSSASSRCVTTNSVMGVADPASKALTPSHVRNNPLI